MTEWKAMDSAPRDRVLVGKGVYFCRKTGKIRRGERLMYYGKTSHVPLYGWNYWDGPENAELWEPERWRYSRDGRFAPPQETPHG